MRTTIPIHRAFALFFASYFLLAGMLPGTDFGQLQLLPNMLEHYQAHRLLAAERGASESLWAFIWEHAISPADHDDLADHSHAELPFQVMQTSVQLFLSTLLMPGHALSDGRRPASFFEAELMKWIFRSDIFHPPSLA